MFKFIFKNGCYFTFPEDPTTEEVDRILYNLSGLTVKQSFAFWVYAEGMKKFINNGKTDGPGTYAVTMEKKNWHRGTYRLRKL